MVVARWSLASLPPKSSSSTWASTYPATCIISLEPSPAPDSRVATLEGLCYLLGDLCDLSCSGRANSTVTHCLTVSLCGIRTTSVQNHLSPLGFNKGTFPHGRDRFILWMHSFQAMAHTYPCDLLHERKRMCHCDFALESTENLHSPLFDWSALGSGSDLVATGQKSKWSRDLGNLASPFNELSICLQIAPCCFYQMTQWTRNICAFWFFNTGEILSDQNLMEILKCSMEPDVVQFIKIKWTI